MGDYAYGEIQLGGKINQENGRKLIGLLSGEEALSVYRERIVESGDCLADFVDAGGKLSFTSDRARNGEFADIEQFCKANGLSFIRTSDAFGEWDAEMVVHTPESTNTFIVNANGAIMVHSDYIKQIKQKLELPMRSSITASYLARSMGNAIAEVIDLLDKLCPPEIEIPKFESC